MKLKSLVSSVNALKLSSRFRYFRIKSGSVLFIFKYNTFFERLDVFGIKFSSMNLKKLREGRTSLGFLRMLRRASRDSYHKFTKNTEVQYNILANEGGFGRNMPAAASAAKVFRRSSNFHIYSTRAVRLRNLTNMNFALVGFSGSYSSKFFLRSHGVFTRLIGFGRRTRG